MEIGQRYQDLSALRFKIEELLLIHGADLVFQHNQLFLVHLKQNNDKTITLIKHPLLEDNPYTQASLNQDPYPIKSDLAPF